MRGAIVSKGQGAEDKEKALSEVGVLIAGDYEELARLIKPFA